MTNISFVRLYNKQQKIEEQLEELEIRNDHIVIYDYDDYGNRNGYSIDFKDKNIAKQYQKLWEEWFSINQKLMKAVGL